jgi:serine/threonine protein kinase
VNPEPRQSGTYELPRGSVVGKYEIMRRLAVGGMAEIYLARITGAAGFEKLVVLKRILPSVAEDPTFVNMFLDEARLAATLRHPNIADVYDVGEFVGTYFFTMEYVYGQDVRTIRHDSRKQNEGIPLTIALAIVHGAASALDHAHEKVGADGKKLGLVHRDVSASNVMVSYDGAVKLLDFGIARASSSTHKTQTGTLKGKIPYMSPEQCKGLPLDRRSDLFSLGVVLYELTVGKRPFRGDSDFAVMDQIVYQGAKPPSELVPGYPPELEMIVMKLLARGPSSRYATGEELLKDLDDFIGKHGLWLSPRAIGKYMRTLFADKIAAWEQAEQEGVPFAQHVAHTITSQSQRSELLTPPTDFPGVGPRTTSQQMAAVQAPIGRRTSKPMPAMQPLETVSPPARSYAQHAEAFARESEEYARQAEVPIYPALKPRSSKTILLAFVGALVLGAGGVLGFMLNKNQQPAAAVEPQEPPKQMDTVVAPPPSSSEPAKEPAKVEPTVPTVPVVDTQPTVASPPTATEAKPAATKPEPAVTPPPKKPVVQKPVRVKKPSTPKEPKEQTWDPNSPFLPQ